MTGLWRRQHRLRWGFIVLAQLYPLCAQADARRVVLLDPGIELTRAARVALEPWQVELIVVSAPTPGATAPSTHERAKEIARSEDAVAVVWTSASSGGYALWMYARAGEHVVARRLSTAPPFDPVSAAAVALSIKTLLRHSETAPVAERYGALPGEDPAVLEVQQAPADPSRAASAQASSTVTTSGTAAPLNEAAQAEVILPVRSRADEIRSVRAPRTPSNVQLELSTSTRILLTGTGVAEPRFGAGATWWLGGTALGIAAGGTLGPALAVDEPAFRGTLRDYGAAVLGRLRHDFSELVRLTGSLGLRTDITQLDGTALADARPVRATQRVVPSVAVELGADWLFSRWTRIGLRAGGAWVLRTQRYFVQGDPVVELSRRSYEGTLLLAVSLPRRL